MRNTDAPLQKPTVYGPQDLKALSNLLSSVALNSSPADVANRMSAVSRALSTGIAACTDSELMQVLSMIRDISFSKADAAEKLAAVSGPMPACATIASYRLAFC